MTNDIIQKHKGRPIKMIWDVFTWILIAIVVLAAIAFVGIRLFGLRPYSVLSGSMEPTYQTGALIYVKKVDYKALEVGEPITFLLDEDTVVTHRIVEIIPDEEEPDTLRFRTKGDSNESADAGLVHYKNVIGMPVFTVPYLGYAAEFIQNPPGSYITIAIGAFLIILVFLPDLFSGDPDEKKMRGS